MTERTRDEEISPQFGGTECILSEIQDCSNRACGIFHSKLMLIDSVKATPCFTNLYLRNSNQIQNRENCAIMVILREGLMHSLVLGERFVSPILTVGLILTHSHFCQVVPSWTLIAR